MTVSELGEKMDAAELMEWAAYFRLQNEAGAREVQALVDEERSMDEKASLIRSFLSSLRPRPNGNKHSKNNSNPR